MICLLQASRYDPNNTSKLFDLAYLLGSPEYNHNQLSAYLYNKIIEFNPSHALAFNNLGVSYGEIKIIGEKYKSFTKSKNLGYSLASSNVARENISIGNYNEAKQILNEASKLSDVHENVFYYLNDIAQKEKKETELKEKIFVEAQEQISFLSRIGDFFLLQLDNPFVWDKNFLSDTGSLEVRELLPNGRRQFLWKINSDEFSFSLFFDKEVLYIGEGTNSSKKVKYYSLLNEEQKHIEILFIEEAIQKLLLLKVYWISSEVLLST